PLPNNYTWEMQTNKLRSLAQDERFNSTGLVQLGLAYDFFSNAPAANVTELWNITRDNNLSVITTHFLGGPWGDVNSPVRFHEYDMLNHSTPVVFSHASFLTKEDANLLRETDQYICTTAESEFHYGHDHPHAHNIQDQAALGIDTHFTYSSSMVTQARLWLQSLRAPQYLEVLEDWEIPRNNPMSVYQAFHLITRAGALALRRDDIGIIAPGAKADIVTFRGDTPNMLGWEDPVAAVILHSNTGDIEDVLVNGQYVKRGGKLMYGDYASLSRRFLESSKRIKSIWNNMDWPRLEGIFNNISPYADADVIDTQRGDGSGYYAQSGALQR
ncbi:Metallo-dependent hydrolase, partial [Hortaea werneckii]